MFNVFSKAWKNIAYRYALLSTRSQRRIRSCGSKCLTGTGLKSGRVACNPRQRVGCILNMRVGYIFSLLLIKM